MDRRTKALQIESVSPINQLPIEILVKIISFASSKRPFVTIPYQCTRFSRVCRRWRLAILDNAVFWKSIIINPRMTLVSFLELLGRSKTTSLEIKIGGSIPKIWRFIENFGSEAGRVKTVYLDLKDDNLLLDLLSFLPSLQNVFCSSRHLPDIEVSRTLRDKFHIKALQISIEGIQDLKMIEHFHGLRWLNLTFEISMSTRRSLADPSQFADLIHAPKLSYLDVLLPVNRSDENLNNLGGFDFSRINHICSGIGGPVPPFISGKHEASEPEDTSCFSFNRCRKSVGWIFDETLTSYPNQLNIALFEVGEDTPKHSFSVCFGKTTNLREIVLNTFDPKSHYLEAESFFKALTGVRTVCKLKILCGKDFESLCTFLGNPTICPNLERLTYSGLGEDSTWARIYFCLTTLLEKRSTADCFKPLEIDIKGFQRLPPEALRRIRNMGAQIVWK
ncbi:hypothetical protein Clacol_000199 [Clathrus columnatus]|uniref:F-box domain-containing protein n=1 Tax=Clathrus columnatus TaxID=1419009 RepID=A0AAV4ZY80_9AGAM|nr:hypothetical protein Clacol_000199 [Clathrus columnatus]